MKKNVGTVDIIIRIVLGLAVGIWGIIAGSWWGLIGLLPILTGIISFCPLYAILGMNTCKVKDL